jgi:hypothetical protein
MDIGMSTNSLENHAYQSSKPLIRNPTLDTESTTTAVNQSPIPHEYLKEDAAEDLGRPLPGWPEVAKLISVTPGYEAFSAFRDLHIKSLLYYQNELSMLRNKLHKVEYDDFRRGQDGGDEDTSRYRENLDYLLRSRVLPNRRDRKQWEIIMQMRGLLKEYSMLDLDFVTKDYS